MLVYGLTGGIGTGKSTAGVILKEFGIPVIDTDEIARDLTSPGRPELAEIAATFGGIVLSKEGLDRKKLAEIVFASEADRKKLEQILHPRIRAAWRANLQRLKEEGREKAAVVIIPLLFETGAENELDKTICVGCLEKTQQKRLQARGWSAEHIRKRLDAQLPLKEKMDRANYVVWNEFDLGLCRDQIKVIIAGEGLGIHA